LIEIWAEGLAADEGVLVFLTDDRPEVAELILVGDEGARGGVLMSPYSTKSKPTPVQPRRWPIPVRPRRRKRRWFFLEVSVEDLEPMLYRCRSDVFVWRALQAVNARQDSDRIDPEHPDEWGILDVAHER
jgi:hypothetical protein